MKKRRREIFVEIARLRVSPRRNAYRYAAWCEACAAKVNLVPAGENAASAGTDFWTSCERIIAAALHANVMLAGKRFVCFNSPPSCF